MQNLQVPLEINKTKDIFLKLKAVKFCVINNKLYWKDPGGLLINFLVENEEKRIMSKFHKGDCGGHHYWKAIVNNILRDGFYWPTMFSDVYKEISSCHECQIFDGKNKIVSFTIKA